jgi:3-oxoacyl-[acyl-carrier-protein] synthase-3
VYQWIYAFGGSVKKEDVLRGLVQVWADFSSRLDTVPLIDKINRGKFRLEDYKLLLLNHRQQVVEGGRWIARAASSMDDRFFEVRSKFMKHCVTEHKDFRMLEKNYVSVGGLLVDIRNGEKNIGTEALNAFMFHRASQPNPFDLLGAMFIIEGLGKNKAGEWGAEIRDQLGLADDQVSVLLYHAEHDHDHIDEFHDMLGSGILEIEDMGKNIIKTAKVTARLYQMQLEEIGNV